MEKEIEHCTEAYLQEVQVCVQVTAAQSETFSCHDSQSSENKQQLKLFFSLGTHWNPGVLDFLVAQRQKCQYKGSWGTATVQS